MKKTLTAIALFATLATGAATTVSANPHISYPGDNLRSQRTQDYYYYFGAPCCNKPMAVNAPCGAPATCAPACNPCCAPAKVSVPYEQVCTTTSCDPCGSSWF